ncbi:MAG TPA: hypothetical protein VGL09_02540 [Methylomirabilota bacterium]|jgi:hypothetical protein
MEPTAEMFTKPQEARIVVQEMWVLSLLRRIAAAAIILAALTGLAAIAFAGSARVTETVVTSRGDSATR